MTKKIAIIGSGSWGTAISYNLSCKNYDVCMWVRKEEKTKEGIDLCDYLKKNNENIKYLPGVKLNEKRMHYSNELKDVLDEAELVVCAIPSRFNRQVLRGAKEYVNRDSVFCSVTKGIETKEEIWFGVVAGTKIKRMSQIISEELKVPYERIAVISGPSIAKEVARDIPTMVVCASESEKTAEYVSEIFSRPPYLKVFTSKDVAGVEYGGAFKNMVALLAGICDGFISKNVFGENTKAALINRGFAEMKAFGYCLGADLHTMDGLSGQGDINVTCYSEDSRNLRAGRMLANGKSIDEILNELNGQIPEGFDATKSIYTIIKNEIKVDFPLTKAVYRILYENKEPLRTIEKLMDSKPEIEHELLKKIQLKKGYVKMSVEFISNLYRKFSHDVNKMVNGY